LVPTPELLILFFAPFQINVEAPSYINLDGFLPDPVQEHPAPNGMRESSFPTPAELKLSGPLGSVADK
jgi:hypothetical protein